MRAHGGLKASDYAVPVLGLIFLKFAENKYNQHEPNILKEYQKDKGTRMERTIQQIAIAKCGFYLLDDARFEYLLNLPGDIKMATALRGAMKGIAHGLKLKEWLNSIDMKMENQIFEIRKDAEHDIIYNISTEY